MIGIRLPSTLKSDAAWYAAHRAAWVASFLAGAVFIAGGVAILFGAVMAEAVMPSVVLSSLMLSVIAIIQAHSAAKNEP